MVNVFHRHSPKWMYNISYNLEWCVFLNSGMKASRNKITYEAAVSQLFAMKIKLQQIRMKTRALGVFCVNSIG